MDPFQHDGSFLDMSSFTSDSMANMMGVDMSSYTDDIQMELGDVSAIPYNSVEQAAGSVAESDIQAHHGNNGHGESSMTGIGAGPLPTGFNAQPTNAGSTLTEFTKRRNWSQRVIEEIKDLYYILTPDARFLYVSPSSKLLTGYEQSELTGQFVQEFIHPEDSSLFLREFNESIATGHQLRLFYRFRTRSLTPKPQSQGPNAQNQPQPLQSSPPPPKYMILEVHGHPHLNNDVSHLELAGGPRNPTGFCAGFFMMARPYPTKNAVLLDSFLEHKLENERLRARIATLKKEEVEEAEAQANNFHKRPGGNPGSGTPSQIDSGTAGLNRTETGDSESQSVSLDRFDSTGSMPPPAKPTISNLPLTREALDEANTFTRPDSITDKMARYNEGSSHVDSIEMLTGLNYRAGERALGISTGGTSPALIRGDAGIDIPADKSVGYAYGLGYGDKKPKKVKSADEYVCTDCGTLDSPEWRKGPMGPKTLCNACGLRWAKKEKKRTGSVSNNNGNGGNTGSTNSGMASTVIGTGNGQANAGGVSNGMSASNIPTLAHGGSSSGTQGSAMSG